MFKISIKVFVFIGSVLLLFTACSGVDGVDADVAITRVASGGGSEVMLQAFHWESHESSSWWNEVNWKATTIADAGFTLVWMPPSSAAASDEGYLPNQLYVQNSAYGTQTELQSSISSLHSKGIKVIADIVINHRVGTADWADFTQPTWGSDSVCSDDEWPGASGSSDTGDGYAAARDIDHTKSYVQSSITDWMNWLKNTIGYDGWRYDYVKGYNGYYNKVYNNGTGAYFSVGELWPDITGDYNASGDGVNYHRQALVDWINATDGTSTAFDFTTKWQLMLAVENSEYWRLKDSAGKPIGLIGWWGAKATTFLDNHDTGSSPGGGQNHWPFPSGHVEEGYAYILTHPGTPTVYWPHFFTWGTTLQTAIKDIISIRKTQGINSQSSVAIQVADSSKYAAIIDSKVAVKIGSGDWSPGSGWVVKASGNNWCIWIKDDGGSSSGSGDSVRTVVFMNKETVSGQDIFIKGGHDAGLVPSVYSSMDEPITYNNTLNTTTASIKAADSSLDWNTESALDWTCNAWPSSWGTAKTYAADGFGEDPENNWGTHWWKLDVMMTGSVGEWFEFKAFMREGSNEYWETDINQADTPYDTINHWGKKGYITRVAFGESWVEFIPLN